MNRDVVIIGAGPAGTAAAIELARAGRDVEVLDRAVFPRDKTCGDGLTAFALRQLDELGFSPEAVADWCPVTDIHLRTPAGRRIDLSLPDTGWYSCVTPRVQLDHALVGLARDAGATVSEGARVTHVELRDGGALVTVGDARTVTAASVIAADGMWSPTRKFLGLDQPGYRGEFHALRCYATTSNPAATDQWIWFDEDLLPGYAWSFPAGPGRVNVGIAVHRDETMDGGELKAQWDDVLARPHLVDAVGPFEHVEDTRAWPIPARLPDVDLHVGPVLFVGDAARATDPLTGEGIAQALRTGRLAARAILGDDEPGPAYAAAAHAELDADHRMAEWSARLLDGRRRAEWCLRVAGSGGWTRRRVARWMFEDEPRAIAVTPRRWHRQLFRRPGAYHHETHSSSASVVDGRTN